MGAGEESGEGGEHGGAKGGAVGGFFYDGAGRGLVGVRFGAGDLR